MAATVALDSVYKVTAKSGKVYYYAWKGKGAPRLLAEPGSAAFVAQLAEALAGRNTGDKTKIAGLCIMWKSSDAWQKDRDHGGLADSTKKSWRPFIDDIQTHFGKLSIAQFDRKRTIRPHIKKWRDKWRDKPRQADMAKQVLSSLCSFAVEENLLADNPCIGLKNYYDSDRADRIWTADELAKFERAVSHQIASAARLAALTGLRQGDLLRLSWSHIDDLAIEIRTSKSKRRNSAKKARLAVVPMYDELREFLATLPRVSTSVLTNSDGHPWKSGFSSSWNKALRAAGFIGDGIDADLHFHDLRGTAATRMYLGGLDEEAIADIFGWSRDKVRAIIDRYVRRDELLKERIARINRNTRRTDSEKKPEKKSG